VSSPRCNRGASRCGGSTPSVRTLGMKLWRQSASLAPRRSGFDSRRLHSSLRSVNGKHTPFVRPRCGFDSCRRLLRGRSSEGRAPERHSREARSIRVVRFLGPWCKRKHGELQPRRSGFETWRACVHVVTSPSGAVVHIGNTRCVHYPAKGINWDLVALGSVPDTTIARQLGVAAQVVWKARSRRGIPRFRAPEHAQRSAIDWDQVDLGERPDSVVARDLGVTRRHVCAERLRRRIPAFVGLVLTQEGNPCRSIYEAMYDAWLHAQSTPHEHEVRVPQLPYIADFYVASEYIEVVGMGRFGRYAKKHEAKRRAYEATSLPVQWLYPADVEALFADCHVALRYRTRRLCEDCGKETHDLVKGVCRRCYMPRWRRATDDVRSCEQCNRDFITREPRRFCSHSCYAKSLELCWPDWDELERRIAEKPIRQVAFDLGVRPGTLSMRIRRKRLRDQRESS
jgi:hypothetical protein